MAGGAAGRERKPVRLKAAGALDSAAAHAMVCVRFPPQRDFSDVLAVLDRR
jgi:hypothetical protein